MTIAHLCARGWREWGCEVGLLLGAALAFARMHRFGNRHNPKANVTGQDDITGVLDGQQRLTALYLGLLGSYAYKEPWKRWTNAAAFPKGRLCFNPDYAIK